MRRNDTGLSRQRVPMRPELALTADEARHTRRVSEHLAAEIARAGGWIDFERYMDIALYAPGLGYYSAGAHKLGRGGDFTTAPEISRLFGACVAQQCADVLKQMTPGIDIGDRRGQRPPGGGCIVAARYARSIARALSHPRDQRGFARPAAPRDRRGNSAPAGARRVDRGAPRRSRSMGSFSPTKCSTPCRWCAFAGTPRCCEELGVAIERGRFVWSPRPASATTRAVCDALESAGGGWQDGYSRSIARGSKLGLRK